MGASINAKSARGLASYAGCDTVFHLAALIAIPYSYIAPASYVEANINGTLNVLQACLDTGVGKLVHTSTSETYGSAQYVPIDEAHPLKRNMCAFAHNSKWGDQFPNGRTSEDGVVDEQLFQMPKPL